jgi:polyphosphate kinase
MSRSTKAPALDDPRLYINRELGLLEFQRRVLEEAQDERNPLLERAKFLAIFGSNLDEFFMVRVSGIRRQVLSRIVARTPAGMTPREELAAIRRFSIELMRRPRASCAASYCPDWPAKASTSSTMRA